MFLPGDGRWILLEYHAEASSRLAVKNALVKDTQATYHQYKAGMVIHAATPNLGGERFFESTGKPRLNKAYNEVLTLQAWLQGSHGPRGAPR